MAIRHYRHLISWQLADRFSAEVQRLVHESPVAQSDQRYREQLLGAAEGVSANVAEGFLRFSRADFARFLSYALGSLGEAETRLQHGVRRRYFTDADTAAAQQLARRALTAIIRLKRSLAREPRSSRARQ